VAASPAEKADLHFLFSYVFHFSMYRSRLVIWFFWLFTYSRREQREKEDMKFFFQLNFWNAEKLNAKPLRTSREIESPD
jgi:hypothetical protein